MINTRMDISLTKTVHLFEYVFSIQNTSILYKTDYYIFNSQICFHWNCPHVSIIWNRYRYDNRKWELYKVNLKRDLWNNLKKKWTKSNNVHSSTRDKLTGNVPNTDKSFVFNVWSNYWIELYWIILETKLLSKTY